MVRKVFPNAQVAHVWAALSQSEGRSGNGQFYFRDRTIYSYRDSWPLAHIMPDDAWQGRKRLIIGNDEKHSITTSHHLTLTRWAMRDDDEALLTSCAVLRAYLNGPREEEADRRKALFAAIINEAVDALHARAKELCKVHKAHYSYRAGYVDGLDGRIASLTDDHILALRERFGVDASQIKPYSLEALHGAIRAAYAKHNDPKRVKARARNATRASLTKFRSMAERFTSGSHERWRTPSIGRPGPQASGVIAEALRAYPDEASRIMTEVQAELARREADATHSALNPDAHSVMWRRVRGTHATKVITAEQWEAGASGSLNSSLTLVRREGAELVTSRGARVPFKRAVAAFLLAQDCRAKGEAWVSPPNHAFPIGAFQLDRIDAEGTLRAGCHTIGFETMLRLALREVPHLVKARYPVPALITA